VDKETQTQSRLCLYDHVYKALGIDNELLAAVMNKNDEGVGFLDLADFIEGYHVEA
jgi:hypothetical protein